MSLPNQKIIYIERSSESVKKDFLKVSNTNLFMAMSHLDANAFKLWVYFVDNANGYKMDLYPCDFQRVAHVSYDTYKRCFKTLVDKGYLKASPKAKNIYIFSETSELITEEMKADMIESMNSQTLAEIKEYYF